MNTHTHTPHNLHISNFWNLKPRLKVSAESFTQWPIIFLNCTWGVAFLAFNQCQLGDLIVDENDVFRWSKRTKIKNENCLLLSMHSKIVWHLYRHQHRAGRMPEKQRNLVLRDRHTKLNWRSCCSQSHWHFLYSCLLIISFRYCAGFFSAIEQFVSSNCLLCNCLIFPLLGLFLFSSRFAHIQMRNTTIIWKQWNTPFLLL